MRYASVISGVLGMVGLLAWQPAAQAAWPDGCREATIAGHQGAPQRILVCVPSSFNGSLIVYAHGYVRPQQPLDLPDELGDADLRNLIRQLLDLGFAFATSSYSKTGYAVKQARSDLNALVKRVKAGEPGVDKVYIVGASEGGLIATMLLEKHPNTYKGGLALCAPLAGVSYQVSYAADVRVVFDHFYPGVFGAPNMFPFRVPEGDAGQWGGSDGFKSRIAGAIRRDPGGIDQVFDVAGVTCSASQATKCAQDILRYSVAGTNDLLATAGGWPVGNRSKRYKGSRNDGALNTSVRRFSSANSASSFVRRHYRPTGRLSRHLVTLHTLRDPLIPYRHEHIYFKRARSAGRGNKLTVLPVDRAGHCAFKAREVVGALATLLLKTDRGLALELALDLANPLNALRQIIDLDAGTGRIAGLIGDRARNVVGQIDGRLDDLDDLRDAAQDRVNAVATKAKPATQKIRQIAGSAGDRVEDLF